MNSIVDPFVMKKLLKSGIFGSVNSTLIHCSLWKSQHLLLLYNEQCMNNSCITPKRVKIKKKCTKREDYKRRRSKSPIQTDTKTI